MLAGAGWLRRGFCWADEAAEREAAEEEAAGAAVAESAAAEKGCSAAAHRSARARGRGPARWCRSVGAGGEGTGAPV